MTAIETIQSLAIEFLIIALLALPLILSFLLIALTADMEDDRRRKKFGVKGSRVHGRGTIARWKH